MESAAIMGLTQTLLAPFTVLGAVVLGVYLLWRWRQQVDELARALGIRTVSAFGITATVAESVEQVQQKAATRLDITLAPEERRAFQWEIERLRVFAAGKRILWVDDNPLGNEQERSALGTLGVEVFMVRSTEAAIEELTLVTPGGSPGAAYLAPYHLVITDWSRVPLEGEAGKDAALTLLTRMEDSRFLLPVMVYHGRVSREEANERVQRLGRWPQVIGSTDDPRELLKKVLTELARPPWSSRPIPGQDAGAPTSATAVKSERDGRGDVERNALSSRSRAGVLATVRSGHASKGLSKKVARSRKGSPPRKRD